MAFRLTIDSKFRPFSYEELLAPALRSTQAHREVEDQYTELATKANVWEEMADEQSDPYAYNLYKNYARDLESQADALAKEGLTPGSRQNMLKMRERYASDIVPIETAYKRRQELIDEQRKLSAQDSTLMYDRVASDLSLDDLIRNPELSYQSYSGAVLSKQVGTAAANMAKEMRNNPRKWRSILNDQYYETLMQTGFSSEAVLDAVQNNPRAAKELTNLVEETIDSSGIRNWGNIDILDRAYDYARQGLWNAVGETKYQTLSNKEYDFNQQLEAARLKKKIQNDEERNKRHWRSIGNTRVGEKKTKELKSDIDFINAILKDPSMIDKESTRYIPGQFSPNVGAVSSGSFQKYKPNEERMANISKRYGFDIKYSTSLDPSGNVVFNSNLEDLNKQLTREINQSAIRNNSYIIDITDPTLIFKNLRENASSVNSRTGKTGVYEFEDNEKKGTVSIDEIVKYFNSNSQLEYNHEKKSFIVTGTHKKSDGSGEVKSFLIDPEIITGETIIDKFDNRRRNKYQAVINDIERSLQSEDYDRTGILIDDLLNDVYYRFNTLSKKQGNTLSNNEENS